MSDRSRPDVAALHVWERKVSRLIRSGLFDAPGPRQQALAAALAGIARDRVALGHPKALGRS